MNAPDALAQDGTYPRPQLVRETWADLGGTWDFAYDDTPGATPTTVDFDHVIVVPFPPESSASGIGEPRPMPPTVWYRRTITADDAARAGLGPDRPRLLLHLGAVDWASTVWVGGDQVGQHVGGHSPFTLDITTAVGTLATPVELVVRAFDDPLDTAQARGKQDWHERQHSIWYDRTTGIWQPVWLEAVPELHVRELQWTPRPDDAVVELELHVSRRPPEGAEVAVRLLLDEHEVASGRWPIRDRDWCTTLTLADLLNGQAVQEYLWSPEHPRLLRAEVVVSSPGGCDPVGSYVGLRTTGTSATDFLLNDRPYFLRAVLGQGYWPQSHLAAPSAAALRDEVRLIKELGFNCVRVHQKAEDPRFLYWADREGLLVWAEMASTYTFSRRAVAEYMSEWVALVRRDRSHPCIATWVPLNESWGVQAISRRADQQAYALALAAMTRALDPDRPVISNDGWEHVDSDLWTVHDYSTDAGTLVERYGTPESAVATVRTGRPEGRPVLLGNGAHRRPVVLSEFGGVSYDSSRGGESWGYSTARDADDFAHRLGNLGRAVNAAHGLAGYCYTQLTDTGLETNGLLRADRTPKLPAARLRSLLHPPRHNETESAP